MVNIPYIKIPQIHIRGISSARNIYPAQDSERRVSPATPTPIIYLTQWKIVGNSEVHGVGNLTSWKVSGNSIVQDGVIMSCGDLGPDGKYHVKISNGVTIYDIALTEPLRKVDDAADTIELASYLKALAIDSVYESTSGEYKKVIIDNEDHILYGLRWDGTEYTPDLTNNTITIEGVTYNAQIIVDIVKDDSASKALVTRNTSSIDLGTCTYGSAANGFYSDNVKDLALKPQSGQSMDVLCAAYPDAEKPWVAGCMGISTSGSIWIGDKSYESATAIKNALAGVEMVYKLATPTTELVDVSPIAVSPTDTYTSANVVPFSAFEHTEDKEIWSCGEYNPTDGKWHILVQPQGGSIADIALTEPLRKCNAADTIEFPSNTEGKALVTRNLKSLVITGNERWSATKMDNSDDYYMRVPTSILVGWKSISSGMADILCSLYEVNTAYAITLGDLGIGFSASLIRIGDNNYRTRDSLDAFKAHINGMKLIYELATPTTELVDAPQIEEADSYSMVISQGGKAVEWSGFETS